jgi:hypothetical protein
MGSEINDVYVSLKFRELTVPVNEMKPYKK